MKINLNDSKVVEINVEGIKGKNAKIVMVTDGTHHLVSIKPVYDAMENSESAKNKFKHIHYNDDDLLLSKRVAERLYPRLRDLFGYHTNRLRLVEYDKIIDALMKLPDSNARPYLQCLTSKKTHKKLVSVKARPLNDKDKIHSLKAKLDYANTHIAQLENQNAHDFNMLDKAKEDLADKESHYNNEIYRLGNENDKLRKENKKLNEFNFTLKQAKTPKLTRWDHFKAIFRSEA